MREIERGGLLTLDATNLLRMVLAKAESVLLTRNLKSYTKVKMRQSERTLMSKWR